MRRAFRSLGALSVALLLVPTFIACNRQPSGNEKAGLEEVVNVATDAYIYGFPLVVMDMTRKQMTNVDSAGPLRAPIGQFARMRTFPTAAYRDVPGANTDTLYTTAWIDVSHEPWILSIPDMGDRYYMTPMLDAWTNVFKSPGTRTTGDKPREVRYYWSGMVRHSSPRCNRNQSAHGISLDFGPYLLHWHTRRLRKGSRATGQVFVNSAQLLRQDIQSSAGASGCLTSI